MKHFRILLTLIAIACGASAFAQYDDGGATGSICPIGEYCPPPIPGGVPGNGSAPIDPSPYDPQPGYPGHPGNPYPGQNDRREVYVGQYLQNQSLNLNQLLDLSPWNSRGLTVQSVEVIVPQAERFANLELVADGMLAASHANPRHVVTLIPRQHLILGQTVQNLVLHVRGYMLVERIAINLGPAHGGHPNPGPIPPRPPQPYPPYPGPGPGPHPQPPPGADVITPAFINQTFYSPARLPLQQQMNLRNFRGYRLSNVTVVGRSLNYPTTARIMIDNQIVGTVQLQGAQSVHIYNRPVVGEHFRKLILLVDGPAHIDRVEARLQRY